MCVYILPIIYIIAHGSLIQNKLLRLQTSDVLKWNPRTVRIDRHTDIGGIGNTGGRKTKSNETI